MSIINTYIDLHSNPLVLRKYRGKAFLVFSRKHAVHSLEDLNQ